MSMKPIVRKAATTDLAAVQKLNNEVFEASKDYDQWLNMDWPFSAEGREYYQKALSDPEYSCYIAEVDDRPVGYLIGKLKNFEYRTNRTAEIENMGVTSELRGKGVGTILIDHFKKWCKDQGANSIRVSTYFGYEQAIEFYKKQGLVPLDIVLEGKIEE